MKDKKLRNALAHHLDLINEYLDNLVQRGQNYENLIKLIKLNLGNATSSESIPGGDESTNIEWDEDLRKPREVTVPRPDSELGKVNSSKLVGLNPQPSYVSTEDLVRLRDLTGRLMDSLKA